VSAKPQATRSPSLAELELRAVLDAAVDAVVIINGSGIIETFSRAAEQLFGYRADEVVGRNISMLMPEPFRSQHDGFLQHHLRTGETRIIGKGREVVAARRDGSMFPVALAVGRIDGDQPRFVGFIHDITDRKRAVEALRRERDRAQTYLDLAEVVLLALDREGQITLVNRKGCEILGWPEDELVGRNWFDTCLPQHMREDILGVFHRIISGDPVHLQATENTVLTRSGEEKLIAWRSTVLRDERGLISGTLSSGEDVTEQRRAVEALRKSERLLQDAQLLANLGNFEAVVPGPLPHWSPQMFRILGLDPSGPPLRIAEFVERCVHPADRSRFLRSWRRVEKQGGHVDLQHRIIRPDGTERDVQAIAQFTPLGDGTVQVIGTLHDVTERKRTENEIRQAQERVTQFARLSTMGEMAAGLAHEINQPLTAIATYSQAVQRMMAMEGGPDGDDLAWALQQISAQALRAGEVVSRLRNFVRNRETRQESIDPHRLVEDTLVFADPDARMNDVRLVLEHQPGLPPVLSDPVQIQQVLLNLIRNGIDAINERRPPNREIVIRARVVKDTEVEISVEDHGTGISAEVAQHLGNPFFTTKAAGTGLGVAISRSIVRSHGGRLGHRATHGGGATVFFTLPLVPGSAK
jgi:PAS domain S-box-containing protein